MKSDTKHSEEMSWDDAPMIRDAPAAATPSSSSAAVASSSSSTATCNSNPPEEMKHWDSKTQPLCNLYHYQIILSPSRADDYEEEEDGKVPPVVGEMIDFDEHAMRHCVRTKDVDDDNDNDSGCGSEDKDNDVYVNMDNDEYDDDDESVLDLELLENVFVSEEGHEEEQEVKTMNVVVTSDEDDTSSEESKSKRSTSPKPEEEEEDDRPVKKPKTKEIMTPPSVVEITTKKIAEVKVEKIEIDFDLKLKQDFPEQQSPRPRRRPNCLFVNHFGTRLNDKGQAVVLNVPAPKICSSEDTVSLKTRSTASTSKASSGCSTRTPVVTALACMTSPSGSVPSVVRIVTPNVPKPITSSARIEDIHMEEDDLEPIRHDDDDQGVDMIDSNHLPYIQSLTAESNPMMVGMAAGGPPHMMPGMMGAAAAGMMPVNFNRPFPLLQRRAFLNNCHPMAHPQAFAAHWPGAGFPGQCMPFAPHQLAAFGGMNAALIPPSMTTSNNTTTNSPAKQQQQQQQDDDE